VVERLAASLGLVGRTACELLPTFDVAKLPRTPWVFDVGES
jgi:hypothetical protein